MPCFINSCLLLYPSLNTLNCSICFCLSSTHVLGHCFPLLYSSLPSQQSHRWSFTREDRIVTGMYPWFAHTKRPKIKTIKQNNNNCFTGNGSSYTVSLRISIVVGDVDPRIGLLSFVPTKEFI